MDTQTPRNRASLTAFLVLAIVVTGATDALASPPRQPAFIPFDGVPTDGRPAMPAELTGQVTFTVVIADTGSQYASYHADFERLVLAAAAEWAQYIDGHVSIELLLGFEDGDFLMASRPMVVIGTGQTFHGAEVCRVGPIWEIREGNDPNDAEPDGEIVVAPSVLDWLFWGYPDSPPPNRFDAYYLILHELGHILGFIGSPDYDLGTGAWVTTFDTHVIETAEGHGFNGPLTLDVYGEPLPLSDASSPGVYQHSAVESGPGSLMFPFADFGTRINVTQLELAVLADSDMPIQIPCLDDPDEMALDADADTVPDCADNCPDLPNEDQIDGDGDNVGDACDACPGDANKSLDPGLCGCGSSDVDTDLDGTLDCLDACPGDPDKQHPGLCGCSMPDDDTDADGTPDCDDDCPDDPDKSSAGTCGCGVPDLDSNADGTPDCLESEEESDDDSQEFLDVDEDPDDTPINPDPDGATGSGSSGRSAACGVGLLPVLPCLLGYLAFARLTPKRTWPRDRRKQPTRPPTKPTGRPAPPRAATRRGRR